MKQDTSKIALKRFRRRIGDGREEAWGRVRGWNRVRGTVRKIGIVD